MLQWRDTGLMVTRFFNLIERKIGGLHEAAYLLALFALLSQILGLVRDRLLAHTFGASVTLDVYYAAFRIPDIIFVSIASIVSIFVLIPFLTHKVEQHRQDAKKFLSNITSAFFLFIVCVSGILFFFVPQISELLYPGFTDSLVRADLIMLTRILLLSPIILGISNILASVTQVFKKFFVYALSPILYNLGIIIGIVWLYPLFGLQGLAYGVVLGALLHLLIQVPAVIKEGLLPRFTLSINWIQVKTIVLVSLPRTITLAVNQVALLILVGIASLLPEGSITIFNFAQNIQAAPLSIIGVSYSVAAFPTLARLFSNGDKEAFLQHMITAIRHVLFWSFPSIVLFIVLRAQIVRTILGSGAFDWTDTRLTAAALALFVISLAAHSLMLLFVRGYYAKGATWKPLFINTFSSVLIIAFAFLGKSVFETSQMFQFFLESLFRIEGVAGTSVIVLPLAYSLGMIVNALLFWVLFRRDFGGHLPRFLYTTMGQSFAASVIAGAVAYGGLTMLDTVFNLETIIGVFLQGLIAGMLGIAAGIVVLLLLKNREVKEIWEAFHYRFWKQKPIAPEIEEL